ncbi:DUF6250 domain-containing protein [Gelidibacter salicanalis]|uniref:DUF6250 domain-containing protein n=1 Tax=Gelidibacter salicanalis TaxID=291193 RepID=A0A934KX97_9FLAO|nr:DUF6250 domain-containing protein [Gelidibacter salicanalis]MBJ7882986.1 hypothetical protein [Gelidibacter salicanalis]
MFKNATFIIFLLVFCGCKTQGLLYKNVLKDVNNWVIEQQPNGQTLFTEQGIEVIDAKGCTIWFKNALEAPVKIAYDITIIDDGGAYDRVSDMNCLWMSNDPKHPDDFFKGSVERAGHFPNYHHFTGYYVGYGGHHNSKTRFRRYNGNVDRPLLPEHDLSDKQFMITANKKMHIEIIVKDNFTSYSRDGEVIYKVEDAEPYAQGYFGFRTVNNHMKIESFEVRKI